jgi:predicted Zn finger-like uncharacterized protein
MALAARCSHCSALFRVVADQLKLRGGLVRCGECREVFDAIGSLSYVDDQSLVLVRPTGAAPVTQATDAERRAERRERQIAERAEASSVPTIWVELPDDTPLEPAVLGLPREPQPARAAGPDAARPAVTTAGMAAPAAAVVEGAPVQQPAALDESGDEAQPPASARSAAPATEAPADVEPVPQTFAPIADIEPAPEEVQSEVASFLLGSESPRHRLWRRSAAVACVPLAIGAAFQSMLALREPLLENWPEARPLLLTACSWYGCSAGWPGHSELLAVVGSELAAIPGTDAVELNAAVRSRASFTMALPAIEVTLTDTQNHTVARKVFLPADYLASSGEPSSRIDDGLAPNADLSIRLVFEARGLNAAGFVVYPFYL